MNTYKDNYNHWKKQELDKNLMQELDNLTEDQIKEFFSTNLEFGTAGMRATIGVGSSRINYYTIRKATYGYVQYLKAKYSERELSNGVVIGHDNRHLSRELTLDTANVLSNNGIKAIIYNDLRATPQISFTIREKKCVGGVIITASHNPKEYNGYKLYDEEGCQLIPEYVSELQNHIAKIDDIFSISAEPNEKLIEIIDDSFDQVYIDKVKTVALRKNLNKDFNLCYTPLHGTGATVIPRILDQLGYNSFNVDDEMVSDPNFSALKSSNPEEFEAYTGVIKLSKQKQAIACFATDPDADRLGICALKDGEFKLLTGNETAILMTKYILDYLNESNTMPKNPYIATTVVSTDLPETIATSYGVETLKLLTGFKFIGDTIKNLEGKKNYVFGFEESFGSLVKPFVRDKDSAQAIALCAEIIAYYNEKGMSLFDALNEIYKEYGYIKNGLHSFTFKGLDGVEKIKSLVDNTRNNLPNEVAGIKVIGIEDYGNSKRLLNGKTTTINLPKSNFIKIFLEDGSWFVLRPSGTEPKIKLYFSVRGKNEAELNNKYSSIENNLLQLIKK